MSRLIRTTINPSVEILVQEGEYLQLLQWGLVYGEPAPAPPDLDDVEVAGFLDNETSQTYARLVAQVAAAVASGTGVLPEALTVASVSAVQDAISDGTLEVGGRIELDPDGTPVLVTA